MPSDQRNGAIITPYSYAEAKAAMERASANQRQHEQALRDAWKDWAEKEERYRRALAARIVQLHADDGVAWTVAQDVARGDAAVAGLRAERDIAAGVKEAQSEVGYRNAAERRQLEQLVAWSQRIAPDGQFGEDQVLRAVAA